MRTHINVVAEAVKERKLKICDVGTEKMKVCIQRHGLSGVCCIGTWQWSVEWVNQWALGYEAWH